MLKDAATTCQLCGSTPVVGRVPSGSCAGLDACGRCLETAQHAERACPPPPDSTVRVARCATAPELTLLGPEAALDRLTGALFDIDPEDERYAVTSPVPCPEDGCHRVTMWGRSPRWRAPEVLLDALRVAAGIAGVDLVIAAATGARRVA